MEEQTTTLDEIVEAAARRLDKVLCKYGKANGIVTSRNFSIVGSNVTLQGAELSKVGAGYACEGETIAERVNSLVDAVAADLKAGGFKEVSKSEQRRLEAQRASVEEAEEEDDEEVEITDLDEEEKTEGGENTEETETTEEDGEVTEEEEAVEYTVDQLKDICKKRGIKVPRGATKKVLIGLIEASK